MKRTLLTLATASSLIVCASLVPAHATVAGTIVSGIRAAIAESGALVDVAYVCRHRYYSSRRVCWWTPSRPWRHRYWRSRRW